VAASPPAAAPVEFAASGSIDFDSSVSPEVVIPPADDLTESESQAQQLQQARPQQQPQQQPRSNRQIEAKERPIAMDDYNIYMGGVDLADQKRNYFTAHLRGVKWWQSVF